MNRMRKCLEGADGCKGKYIPKVFWQMTCENQACKKQRKVKKSLEWKKRNLLHYQQYQKAYREI